MERVEAYHLLGKMWEDATSEQAEALSMAQDDLEFVDLMPNDMVAVVRCKDCKHGEVDDPEYFPDQYYCHEGCGWNKADFFCSYGERKDGE